MRGRILALALLVLPAAGCAASSSSTDRSVPGFGADHRVEQINSTGSHIETK